MLGSCIWADGSLPARISVFVGSIFMAKGALFAAIWNDHDM
jgi:hypothetical protein